MKQTALVSFLWPKFVPVLEQYLAARPRIVLTLRGAITVELRGLVSAVGGTVVALEELLDAGEIHTIGQKAAAVNRDASRAMSEQGWVSFAETFHLDAERVKPLITDALLPCVQRQMIVLEALEKAWREYFVELVVVNEDWTSVPRCAVEWAKRHRIPTLHLSHATALVKAYTVHSAVLSDVVAVFGKRGAESLLDAGVPEERIRVTGNPAWDIYPTLRERREQIKHGLFTKYGLNRALPLVIFGATWDAKLTAISDADVYRRTLRVFLSACHTLIRDGISVNFLIKDRPANAAAGRETVAQIADELHLPRERVIYTTADTEALVASADIVISVDSNLSLEALLAGVPAINLVDTSGLRLGPSFDGVSGILDVEPPELSTAIRLLLANASFCEGLVEAMRAKADYYNVGQDGKATERVVALMTEIALKRERNATLSPNKDYVWEELAKGDEAGVKGEYTHPRRDLVEMFVRQPRLVLEIGCAAGATGALIKKVYPEAYVLGVELNVAAAHIAEQHIDKVYAQRMEDIDFATEGIAERSIDTVILGDVLEHMVDPWSTMIKLKPFLAPGAQIIASIPNIRNLWVMNELAHGRWRYEKIGLLDVTHLRFFTLEEIKQFFRETGYNVLKVVSAPDVRCRNIQYDGGSVNIDTGKIVIKNVGADELLELKTLQFLILAMPSKEALPANVIEQIRQAEQHLAQGNPSAAAQALSQAVQLVPHDPEVIVAYGNVLLQIGDVEAARREFVKATVLAPDYPAAHLNLAAVYLHMGRGEEAEASIRRVLAANSADIDALKLLGRLCLDTARYTEAVESYLTVLRHAPHDVETLLIVGNCYAETGRFDQARAFYRKVLSLDPSNAVATDNLAIVDGKALASDTEEPRCATSDLHLTSIIIPVFNRLDLTRQCLEAVRRHTPAGQYELIVVDNGSSDGTTEFLRLEQDAGRLRTVVNTDNMGFAHACNQGAGAALGKNLLFLNNDTEVQPNWFEPLVAVLEADPEVGIVGSKLLFPDGTIQHAGMIIVDDQVGTGKLCPRHVYYKGPADLREANQSRTYQALTGACLLVRRSAFEQVGGFDQRYWNSFEDVDLCLKIQERGLLSVYEPKSVVIHYEYQSGPERFRYLERNHEIFCHVWLGRIIADVIAQPDGRCVATGAKRVRVYSLPSCASGGAASRPITDQEGSTIRSDSFKPYGVQVFTSSVDDYLRHTRQGASVPCADDGNAPILRRPEHVDRGGVASSKLRVLFVNRPDTFTIPGGDTTHMLRLKEGLERLGVIVDICCDLNPNPAGYDLINLFNLLCPEVTLHQAAALRQATRVPIILTPFFWDRSESCWGEVAVPGAIAKAKSRKQLARVLRQIADGTLSLFGVSRKDGNGLNVTYKEKQREILQGVDHLITISAGEERLLMSTFGEKISRMPRSSIVPTGVDAPSRVVSPELFINRFGVRDFVLITGRVEPRKNQLMLLIALHDAGFPIVAAGDQVCPSYLTLCRRFAPEGTHFVGRLDEELLASARSAARVHALPSWWECAGIASMEAALAGCSVVMGNRGAESEYFGDAAYYCNPADVESIRRAVRDAYHNHAFDSRRRQALQTHLWEQYNWDRIAALTLEVYNAAFRACEASAPTSNTVRAMNDRSEVSSRHETATILRYQSVPADSGDVQTSPVRSANVIEQIRQAEQHLAQGNPSAAAQALSQAVQLVPHDPEVIVAYGNVLLQIGDVEAARREFTKATVLHPEYAPAHADLAVVLMHQGRSEESELSARRALELDSTNISTLKVLAKTCLDTERYQEAVQVYATILGHAPNDIETLILVGNCYAEIGRFDQARAFYRKVLSLDPSNAVATDNLAIIDGKALASDTEEPRSANSDPPLTSIIIVTYNSAPTIRACLDSVLKERRAATDLIVVDNLSTDATRSILGEYQGRIATILNQNNVGFSAACNQGIRASSGTYVVLLNSDTVVTPGWVDRLIGHFGPGVGAVGPVSDYVAGLQKYQLYKPELKNGRTVAEIAEQMARVNRGCAVETKLLIGFCLMVPRWVLGEVGLLDEDLFLGNDDLDLSWRLRLKGYKLLVATDTFVHHEGQVSFKSEVQTKTSRLVQESTDKLYEKLEAHYGIGNVPSPMELWGMNWFKPTMKAKGQRLKAEVTTQQAEGRIPKTESPLTPHASRLTSIIILTHNGLEHTRQCLASIQAHTPEPHELIIVDNASSDDTLAYLREYMATHDNVLIVANATNRGFAAGNNQGLALAKGEHVLLLNNDTVVTEGWLRRMLWVFEAYPDVGIVGPVSNYVSGPQLVREASYTSPEELHAFAATWVRAHDGQSSEATRVVGFCLLARKAVIARIGGLDERFGSGNFEDDDYCIRAFQVGFRARIALDAFVHHTGSQTFKAAKIDYRQSLMRNWELFKTKWGIPADTSYEAGYHFPSQSADNVSLSVPLPGVGADHRCEADGRWWQEIGEDRGLCEPAVMRETPFNVIIIPNGHGIAPLWPSLIQHTNQPLAVTIVPSIGNGHAGEPLHAPACPDGWQIGTADLPVVQLLNRLLRSAGDEPVILLSGEVVVTPGWLKRLLTACERNPHLAMVGPAMNDGGVPQQVKADYKGTGKALRQFALRRAHRYGKQLVETESLVPSCIVFNPVACRTIGPLCEDLDLAASLAEYCVRARQSGHRVAAALDAYVHCD